MTINFLNPKHIIRPADFLRPPLYNQGFQRVDADLSNVHFSLLIKGVLDSTTGPFRWQKQGHQPPLICLQESLGNPSNFKLRGL